MGQQALFEHRVCPGLGHQARTVVRNPFLLRLVFQFGNGIGVRNATLHQDTFQGSHALGDGGQRLRSIVGCGHVH